MKSLGSLFIATLFVTLGFIFFNGSGASPSLTGAQSGLLMAQVPPEETATATPIPSPTLGIYADCIWGADASAYIDLNSNGKWDKGEQALADVRFIVDDIYNQLQDVGTEAISNNQGKARLSVWLPGCPKVEFEVYAVPPRGYIPTTQERVSAKGRPEDEPFLFGFKATEVVPGMPGTGHP